MVSIWSLRSLRKFQVSKEKWAKFNWFILLCECLNSRTGQYQLPMPVWCCKLVHEVSSITWHVFGTAELCISIQQDAAIGETVEASVMLCYNTTRPQTREASSYKWLFIFQFLPNCFPAIVFLVFFFPIFCGKFVVKEVVLLHFFQKKCQIPEVGPGEWPPLFSDQIDARKAEEKFFLRPGSP